MKPILFIFSGLPASGKSTLAKFIAKKYGAVYLRIDTIEQGLRDLCNVEVQGEGYRLAYRIAGDNLALGQNVAADSCNPVNFTRREWERVAQENNSIFINIEVLCSDKEEHKKRVETRKSEIAGLQPPDWKDVENREYHLWETDRIIIDTANKTIKESCVELEKKIEKYFIYNINNTNMNINKNEFLQKICYSKIGFARINKKLNRNFPKEQIEKLISDIIRETDESCFEEIGKNYYVTNIEHNIRITINSNTFSVITVNKIK